MHRRHWDEALVLAVGYGYEQATLHRVPPPSFPECTEAEEYIPYSQVGLVTTPSDMGAGACHTPLQDSGWGLVDVCRLPRSPVVQGPALAVALTG